ncbi:hypothetical protein EKD00_01860 [Chlorobium phaeovibrioides]|uniref:P22 coat-protein 5 family protein n=1 Tax=Chlorobium phaeovibrioides TaxID=1094 RepID=A0A432AWG6_CHLPH|nr:P22 phage major capsid protein family protein [Chlorobium phaeovibrioides]KAA6230576.1 hypothetical protein FP507_09925 [Chlorobium phaeovibrioides]MDT9547613.1 P22 phage major capsid protein family protein [Chlorobium phaeovibrioides]MWV55124.1 hypothetical protein [Chlorobium phaeovibrioides]RTY36513.1 hypothetical protein EKD00_01860 [Chlorobium phaeovibrioides]RTY39583.1 hypothetical protein EKD02_02615 [Chlorobium phaeovibrioides]
MANTLNLYDPLFYAQEGLIQLENALGMSARVHRGYDKEPQEKGSTIKISKPGTFLAKDAPSADQDLTPGDTEIRLDRWREVKFSVSDKELAYAGEKIITDHIRPAAYALSNDIDLSLNGLAKSVPWFYNAAATTEVKDLTRVHQVLFNNKVPMNDSLLHLEVGGDLQAGFLELFANSSFAGASSQEVHKSGHIGNRLGFEIFGNQNVGSHVKGTASVATLAVNGAVQKGATSLNLDATAVNGTLVAGDSFSIAGDPQRYVVAATLTAAGNAFSGVQVFPPLAQDAPDNAVVKMDLTNHVENLAFHRNAFALGMAPLSELGNEFGAKVASVVNEKNGLAIRSRMWYDGDNSRVKIALDVLYGIKCLDANLACKLRKV